MIIRSKSPFRISFGGGGTDVPPYCWEHGGAVISTTIDKYAYVTITPNKNRAINIHSLDYRLKKSFEIGEELEYDGKLDIVKATINKFKVDKGCDLLIHSDMPPGSGLGVSSAVTVALIGAFKDFFGIYMNAYEIAELAYHIEREELGMEGGYQDQYASTFGGLNYIEFKNEVIVNPLRLRPEILNELQYRLLLCYTGDTRLSSEIQVDLVRGYTERRRDSVEGLLNLKRIADEMKYSLLKGDFKKFGELLHQGWIEKKRLSNKITNPEIDKLYEIARLNGVIGGKILGAGGGGHLLFFCEFDKKFKVADKIKENGVKIIDFKFDTNGLQIWRVKDEGT
jgi:D-glycero-alpha-D-manno-heptose-7-phosphate kinase